MKDFKFLKKYGQNFLSDTNLLRSIVSDACVSEEDVVLEVGPGAGALSEALLEKAKKVVSVEIDERLIPHLQARFERFDNFVLKNADIMALSDSEIESLIGNKFKVVANIPYYITTQLIMRFLECENKADSITVMVQKEVAERLCAKEGTSDYGVISVAVALYGNAKITRHVNRKMFYPVPEVDSAVVTISVDKDKTPNVKDVMKLVRASFSMRRKTLRNNLTANYGLTPDLFDEVMNELNLDKSIRGERLSPMDFVNLYNAIKAKR